MYIYHYFYFIVTLRCSSLENLSVLQFIYGIFGTENEEINSLYLPNLTNISDGDVEAVDDINHDEDLIRDVIPVAHSNNIVIVETYKNRGSTFSPQIIVDDDVKNYFKFYLKYGREYIIQAPFLNILERQEIYKKNTYLTYRYKKIKPSNMNKPANISKIFSGYIDRKFGVKKYYINAFRKQQRLIIHL